MITLRMKIGNQTGGHQGVRMPGEAVVEAGEGAGSPSDGTAQLSSKKTSTLRAQMHNLTKRILTGSSRIN